MIKVMLIFNTKEERFYLELLLDVDHCHIG